MSLVTLLLFWKFCHCNIFLSISITRPKITISYLLNPLCVWNSKISSEKDRVMLIHHIYFSHMPMAKFCHIPFCQGKESGLWSRYRRISLKNAARLTESKKWVFIQEMQLKGCQIIQYLPFQAFKEHIYSSANSRVLLPLLQWSSYPQNDILSLKQLRQRRTSCHVSWLAAFFPKWENAIRTMTSWLITSLATFASCVYKVHT